MGLEHVSLWKAKSSRPGALQWPLPQEMGPFCRFITKG